MDKMVERLFLRKTPKLSGKPLELEDNDVKSRMRNLLDYKKPKPWVVLVSVVVVAVVCTGLFFNPTRGKQWEVLTDYVIADSGTTLKNGTSAQVKLVMTEGTHYEVENPNYIGGTYDENYQGDYELQLTDTNGTILSVVNLNVDWDYSEINFGGEFNINFTDYNNDNCPDFTIGTNGASSFNLYYLYTINKENLITRMYRYPISEMSKNSSAVFDHDIENEQKQFMTYVYNKAIDKYGHCIYEWDEDTYNFVMIDGPKYEEQ